MAARSPRVTPSVPHPLSGGLVAFSRLQQGGVFFLVAEVAEALDGHRFAHPIGSFRSLPKHFQRLFATFFENCCKTAFRSAKM